MILVTVEMLERVKRISQHPFCGSTAEKIYEALGNPNVEPNAYLDVMEMQLDVLARITEFYQKRTSIGDTQERALCAIGAALGVVVGRVTHGEPVEGQGVANYLGQEIADRFNQTLAQWFAWRETPPPKTPTHQPHPVLN